MPRRGAVVLLVLGILLFVTGLILPVVGSSLGSYEESRAASEIESELAGPDCDPPEFVEENSNESVQTGAALADEECLEDHDTARQDALASEQRGWVMWIASAFEIGGWAMRFGGLLWLSLAWWLFFY